MRGVRRWEVVQRRCLADVDGMYVLSWVRLVERGIERMHCNDRDLRDVRRGKLVRGRRGSTRFVFWRCRSLLRPRVDWPGAVSPVVLLCGGVGTAGRVLGCRVLLPSGVRKRDKLQLQRWVLWCCDKLLCCDVR